MDFGRETKKIRKDFYARRFFLKKNDVIEYSSESKIGRIFNTRLDEKGRLYIPMKLFGENVVENKPYAYLYGHLALSSFRCAIYFHKSKEENKSISRDIKKGFRPLHKIVIDYEKEQEIFGRFDTNVIIDIDKLERQFKNETRFRMLFQSYFIYTKLSMTKKRLDRKNQGKEQLPMFESVDKKSNAEKVKFYKRYRINIPSDFLDFCEIDKYKDNVILFSLEDETEIWSKSLWDSYVNKRIWLSEKGKYILQHMGGEWKGFVCAENDFFLKSLFGLEKTK